MYGPTPEGDPPPPEIYVVHEDSKGKLDGAMAYEILDRDSWWDKPGFVEVHDLFASTTAYVALWRYLLDIDLVHGVRAGMRMVDEPIRWMLADPRRLEMKLNDQLWLRVLDVPMALEARTYGRPGRLVLDIADPFLGRGGRFEIDSAESGEATCKPTRRSADLEMTIADLGAVYLGGHSFAALAAANRVTERRAGAVARADQVFAHHPLPWCGTFF
jgi:predicted acetyltransferase